VNCDFHLYAKHECLATWQISDRLIKEFLGLTAPECRDHHGEQWWGVNVSMNVREILTTTYGGFVFAPPFAYEAGGDC